MAKLKQIFKNRFDLISKYYHLKYIYIQKYNIVQRPISEK